MAAVACDKSVTKLLGYMSAAKAPGAPPLKVPPVGPTFKFCPATIEEPSWFDQFNVVCGPNSILDGFVCTGARPPSGIVTGSPFCGGS